jgi:hypothetical protein
MGSVIGKINVESIKELAQITAQLAREDIVFEVWKDEFTKVWRIEIKGY